MQLEVDLEPILCSLQQMSTHTKLNSYHLNSLIIPYPKTRKKKSEIKMRKNWSISPTRSETKKFKLHFIICELEGLPTHKILSTEKYTHMQVQIKSKAPRKKYLPRRTVQKDRTSKQPLNSLDGCIRWNEGFEQSCSFKLEQTSWEINLKLLLVMGLESNGKSSVLAKLRMDITEFTAQSPEKIAKLPFKCCINGSAFDARLVVKLEVLEYQNQPVNNTIHPLSPSRLLPSLSSCMNFQTEPKNDPISTMQLSPSLSSWVTFQTQARNDPIRLSSSTSESDEDTDPSYQSIITSNLLSGEIVNDRVGYVEDEMIEENKEEGLSYEEKKEDKTPLMRLLSWNSRKAGYKRPGHHSNTPLLNKAYGEGGGDDIDNARRCHLASLQQREADGKLEFEQPGFMDSDRFEVGNWEKSRVISRDGNLELVAEIFLASIDQRSEKASGGGACSVLAAIVADWLHQNPEILPIRCQFDKLIRDGSAEWRNLCKEETHREKFSDQHFDLETVIQEQVRPLQVIPEKSYVGFFELENMPNRLELLQGAMSFDSIWEELEKVLSSEEQVYIVSWNDHFFVLKIEKDAIYVIDTLGERLSEGCNKAYMIKFSRESVIFRSQLKSSKSKETSKEGQDNISSNVGQEKENGDIPELLCKGKSCCKEFIKGFLAALPLGELQSNIERGIAGTAPLHQLLQIEFQYVTPCNKNAVSMEK